MTQPSDEQILEAVKRGEPHAFDAFVERYGARLRAFGIRMCGHMEDGEDVYQETLLTAFEGLSDVREPRAIRTWLFRVASNACRMQRRKAARTREVSLEDVGPRGDEPELVELPDWSHLPDADAEVAELREALGEAMAELPAEQRIVVLLRDVEGLRTREAAEALRIGESAVKMRLHRARATLRDALDRAGVEVDT